MNNPFGFTAPGWGLGWGWALVRECFYRSKPMGTL